ncbi:MAG: ergothioneine biosynthesis protein EgtB [Gemmatimonadales bacterium]|nr:MAG: ergothioneine biosynthesis protein EgtB [Gemmatimonadales bacterium]
MTVSPAPDPGSAALARYRSVRRLTTDLVKGLEPEDLVVQSMDDVSPTKWHLAHTSWFWEAFLLEPHLPGYQALDSRYHYLFNSYYVHAGERHCRAQRGYLSRPTVRQVMAYRKHVDEGMEALLSDHRHRFEDDSLDYLVELGLNHEQQHQELMLTDLKHVFSVNPLRPAYRDGLPGVSSGSPEELRWVAFGSGVYEIGFDGDGFAYDNEGPRHRVFLEPFALGHRLVTNGEYLAFIEDGGYERPELWMSEGWALREAKGWTEPFYWELREGEWWSYTLAGMRPIHVGEPVVHLTWFEADAFARWSDARLPREAEWEVAVATLPVEGNLADWSRFHPEPLDEEGPARGIGGGDLAETPPLLRQMYGDVWEWTSSSYSPYPGFRPAPGAVGEYNGKFMSNQYVLRGGSCATSASHIRPTYRNFFPSDASWQFSGLRLARDL